MSWLRSAQGRYRNHSSPARLCRARLGHCLLAVMLLLSGVAANGDQPNNGMDGGIAYAAVGKASYYSSRLHGRPTASGEPYDETDFTAAHTDLPLDALVCVTNIYNGRTTTVRINDRGPYSGHRIIDVSLAAAKELGMLRAGTARVKVEICNDLES